MGRRAGCGPAARQHTTTLIALALALLAPRSGLADEPPRILSIEPAREGGLLVCDVRSTGLPGDKLASSIESGLVSSVELMLDLIDEDDHVLAGNRLSFRLAFDLWEEVFSVKNHRDRRFEEMAGVEAFLNSLSHVPVAPADLLDRGGPFRIRAGLMLHPVAPSERERAGQVIVGESRASGAAGAGGREVTFSLGRLIRFFYRGDRRPEAHVEAVSTPFRRTEVSDAED